MITGNETGVPSAIVPFVTPERLITQSWRQFLVDLWKRSGGATGSAVFITGDTKMSASGEIPPGWIPCDGAAVSRTSYANLFLSIGTTWGPGDGTTTFNVPDFRNRVLIGAGDLYALGDTGGAADLTLTVGQLPSHSHGVSDPGHSHSAAVESGTALAGADVSGAAGGSTGSSSTGISIDSTGSGDPVDILPPYAAVVYLIKT